MAQLKRVEFYPTSGAFEALWGEPQAPSAEAEIDRVARLGRGVAERFTEELEKVALQGKVSLLSIRLVAGEGNQSLGHSFETHFHRDAPGAFEMARASIPREVLKLSSEECKMRILATLRRVCTEWAEARNQDPRVVSVCHDKVVEGGLTYRWEGPWKASPNRKLRVRCKFLMADDGFGRMSLVFATPSGLSAESSEQIAWTRSSSFRRAARTLHWTGGDRVSVIPFVGLIREHVSDAFEVRVAQAVDGSLELEERPIESPPPRFRRLDERRLGPDGPPTAASRAPVDRFDGGAPGRSGGGSGPAATPTRTQPGRRPPVRQRKEQALAPDTAPTVLVELAADPSWTVREAVAYNASTPSELLAALAVDERWEVRKGVANHPATPLATLRVLVTDAEPRVRYCVALHPRADAWIQERLVTDDSPVCRYLLAARDDLDPRHVGVLKTDPHDDVRAHLAAFTTDLAALADLVEDASVVVRQWATRSPRLTADQLRALATDRQRSVRSYLVAFGIRPLPLHLLELLARDKSVSVRFNLALSRPPEPILAILRADPDETVARHAAQWRPLPPRPADHSNTAT